MSNCPTCGKPLVRHPFGSELTCFVHGDPNRQPPQTSDCADVAWDREEWEACQMNTMGCCIDHERAPKRGCECW